MKLLNIKSWNLAYINFGVKIKIHFLINKWEEVNTYSVKPVLAELSLAEHSLVSLAVKCCHYLSTASENCSVNKIIKTFINTITVKCDFYLITAVDSGSAFIFFFENCIFIWTLKFVSAWLVELYIITDKKHIDRWRSGEDMATRTRPRWCLSLSWAVDWTYILYQKNWLVKQILLSTCR